MAAPADHGDFLMQVSTGGSRCTHATSNGSSAECERQMFARTMMCCFVYSFYSRTQFLSLFLFPSPPLQQFRAITQRYEISDYFAKKLKQLEGWEIVLILDDSGSMNTPLQDQGQNGPFAKSVTRWDELKNTAGIIVDIGAVMDKDGLDCYFLNRATSQSRDKAGLPACVCT